MDTLVAVITVISQLVVGSAGAGVLSPMATGQSTAVPAGVHLQRGPLAIVVATVTSDDSHVCAGVDGTYLSLDLHIAGPITSADQRLSGNLTGHIQGVIKEQPGPDFLVGDARDDFQVRDTQGVLKLEGTALVVADGVLPLKGLVFARLADASTWVTSVNGVDALIVAEEAARQAGLGLSPHAPFVVELGSPVTLNPADPGVIQTGSCPGGFDPTGLVPPQ